MNLYKTLRSLVPSNRTISNNDTQQSKEAKEAADLASITILLDLTREQIADQKRQNTALDTKASIVLTAATVLVGTVSVLLSSFVTSHAPMLTNSVLRWLPLVLVIVYLVLIATASLAYTVRTYQYGPVPQTLYESYRDQSEYFIKAQAFTVMVRVHEKNKGSAKWKAFWVTCSMAALVLETVLLALLLYFQAIY